MLVWFCRLHFNYGQDKKLPTACTHKKKCVFGKRYKPEQIKIPFK